MTRTSYTAEQREEALALYVELGAAAAAKRTGVPAATLRSWASRAGRQTDRAGQVRAATEAAKLSAEQKRAQLAELLLDDALQLRAQLWQPAERHHYDGGKDGVGWTTRELDRPVFTDQLAIVRAVDVAVRNVQLLTGEDTERIGTGGVDLEAELTAYQQGLADAEQPAPADG